MPGIDLEACLDLIEEKLKTKQILSNKDVEFVKLTVRLFRNVWEWYKQYPEFSSKLDTDLFQSIFDGVSSKFRSTDAELCLMCDYCEEEFPLLNNDPEFAFQMHEQTPKHVKVVNNLKLFHSLSTNALSAHSDTFNTQNNSAVDTGNATVSETDKWISNVNGTNNSEKGIYCSLCNVKLHGNLQSHFSDERHKENEDCVSVHRKKYSCDLCQMHLSNLDKLQAHLSGRIHKVKMNQLKKASNPKGWKNSINSTPSVTLAIHRIYHDTDTMIHRYFLSKTCIFQPCRLPYYYCGLCDVYMTDVEGNIIGHICSEAHKCNVNKVLKNTNTYLSFEPGIICGKSCKCYLCNATLSDCNPQNHYFHLQTHSHKKRAIAHFKSLRFEDWERGIILRKGKPYCVGCNLILPDEICMKEHVNDKSHKCKFYI